MTEGPHSLPRLFNRCLPSCLALLSLYARHLASLLLPSDNMGAELSAPEPGTEFQVIGAGLSRTGTASFSEALRILLGGPVYHTGTQVSTGKGPASEMLSWNTLLSHWPSRTASDKAIIHRILKERFDGFAAATDVPAAQLVEELMEIYPNAKVICTTRDAESWAKSVNGLSSIALQWFLGFVLFPLPSMRHFPKFCELLETQWHYLYGERAPMTAQTYHRHVEWLKGVVPEDKLVFYSVKDGWEPLCKALGKEVPKNMPFPRINDAEAVDKLAKELITKGLMRWAVVFATAGIAVAAFWMSRA
ncbi:hypothetical protein BU26DRAFT_522124 [Trematosphaeria pertusa]|uniref:NAD dependent epimerase/dehydratase n=1 Tax=Trematosphaeria pertusa TaxID=390896 RepID=A0A6A6I6N4_9PLEO|nr:uncharacterized protein BU26DRAFT_522124 [Trematosphaeria pertusa]KAF2245738.1 hypothetical protein BU26DRAFT_522124 [Trematosphaeria pertusa]